MNRIIFIIVGAALGFAVGYQTRPSLLGVKLPLDVLTSTSPMDAPFKSEMMTHLGISIVIGAVVGFILAVAFGLLVSSQNRSQ